MKLPWYMDPENPHAGLRKGISLCHAASLNRIPPSFGDPEMFLCRECGQFALPVWVPIWETVGKGTHRKIAWDMGKMIKNMDWRKITMAEFPPFGEKAIVAQFFPEGEGREPLITVCRLTRIDKDGFCFEGGDDSITNATLRVNRKEEPFKPTHFCMVERPKEQ